jgi:GNAT superfamily N-acetyltransferase
MVRPYRESDAAAVWELKRRFELGLGSGTGADEKAAVYREKLDDEYRKEYLEWLDRCIAEDPRAVQVAERENELVGYVFVLPESLAYVWDAAVLNEIFVVDDHRGSGVGDDLMEAAIAVARDQNVPLDRMVLDVDRENARAQAFYERWGFEHWGEMVARPL